MPDDLAHYRDDITCPKSGDKIPLREGSVCRFTDSIWLAHCPQCRTFHQFIAEVPNGQ